MVDYVFYNIIQLKIKKIKGVVLPLNDPEQTASTSCVLKISDALCEMGTGDKFNSGKLYIGSSFSGVTNFE